MQPAGGVLSSPDSTSSKQRHLCTTGPAVSIRTPYSLGARLKVRAGLWNTWAAPPEGCSPPFAFTFSRSKHWIHGAGALAPFYRHGRPPVHAFVSLFQLSSTTFILKSCRSLLETFKQSVFPIPMWAWALKRHKLYLDSCQRPHQWLTKWHWTSEGSWNKIHFRICTMSSSMFSIYGRSSDHPFQCPFLNLFVSCSFTTK